MSVRKFIQDLVNNLLDFVCDSYRDSDASTLAVWQAGLHEAVCNCRISQKVLHDEWSFGFLFSFVVPVRQRWGVIK